MSGIEQNIIARVEPLVREVVEHEGLELVAVTYQREPHGWVLRVFIDRQGGVTVDDCSEVSSQLGDLLDVQDIIPHRYHLEVSSPGVNRPLKNERDFQRFIGATVRVTTHAPLDGRRRFKGVVRSCDHGAITLEGEGRLWRIPLQAIRKAHLEQEETGEHAS
ncbi:MAG: ribosome maturation factor RimP [Desulfobacterota bacterium]|nr:ribosome maturation factor RimP [Thermodesulfobacteriota bacterium]